MLTLQECIHGFRVTTEGRGLIQEAQSVHVVQEVVLEDGSLSHEWIQGMYVRRGDMIVRVVPEWADLQLVDWYALLDMIGMNHTTALIQTLTSLIFPAEGEAAAEPHTRGEEQATEPPPLAPSYTIDPSDITAVVE